MRYFFLNDQFYSDYAHCTQIEQKRFRPFIRVVIRLEGKLFAIPLRSNIKHQYAFWTDKENRCGADYSKAVIINEGYIDTSRRPYIRPNEHEILLQSEHFITEGMKRYLKIYKKAVQNKNQKHNKNICAFSALQYFHKELGIK